MTSPVVVLGYEALPAAIELSQWGYEVTLLTDNFGEIAKITKDLKIHAGNLKSTIWFDYLKNCPKAVCMCFIGILDTLQSTTRSHSLIDLWLRRVEEVICAVKKNRDWENLLRDKYCYKILPYPNSDYVLLTIKELEE
jgi:hypothetical protein